MDSIFELDYIFLKKILSLLDSPVILTSTPRFSMQVIYYPFSKTQLLFSREEDIAMGLRELFPFSDIALEGSKGIELFEELEKYLPEAVKEPRLSHNAISLNASLMLTIFDDHEQSIFEMGALVKSAHYHDYKVVGWTVSDEDRMNALRKAEIFSDYVLSDAPFYKLALQEMKYYEQKKLSNKE